MQVSIDHNASEDGLSRERWVFSINTGEIVLRSFHLETRETVRHKFKGPKWDSSDERSHYSALSRPPLIPQEVQAKAREEWARTIKRVPMYIGWTNEQCKV